MKDYPKVTAQLFPSWIVIMTQLKLREVDVSAGGAVQVV